MTQRDMERIDAYRKSQCGNHKVHEFLRRGKQAAAARIRPALHQHPIFANDVKGMVDFAKHDAVVSVNRGSIS